MRTSLVSGTTLLPLLVVFTMQCVECIGGVPTAPGITLVTYLDETTAEGATEYLTSTVETMKFTNVHKSTPVTERYYTSKEVTISGVPTAPGITLVTYLDETTAEGATEYLTSTVETMKFTNVHKTTPVTERYYTSKEVTISDVSGNNGPTTFEESTTKSIPTSKGIMSGGTVTPTGVTEPSVYPGRVRNWVVICSITIVAGLAILCTITLTWYYLKQKKLRKCRTNPVLFQLTSADSIGNNENADTLGIDNPLYNIDLELTKIKLEPGSFI